MRAKANANACRRHSGVAMIEFALVLPLLVTLMALIFFFGKGMLGKQYVLMADRQLAWRQAKEQADETANPGQILQNYFANQPFSFTGGGGWEASRQAETELLANLPLAGNALTYASDVVNNPDTTSGASSYLNVNYQVDATLPGADQPANTVLSQFGSDIANHYYRSGGPWKYPDVKVWNPLWNCFVNSFDANLSSQGVGGDQTLVNIIRQLYERPWKAPNDP